jgi:hypothetical protein
LRALIAWHRKRLGQGTRHHRPFSRTPVATRLVDRGLALNPRTERGDEVSAFPGDRAGKSECLIRGSIDWKKLVGKRGAFPTIVIDEVTDAFMT